MPWVKRVTVIVILATTNLLAVGFLLWPSWASDSTPWAANSIPKIAEPSPSTHRQTEPNPDIGQLEQKQKEQERERAEEEEKREPRPWIGVEPGPGDQAHEEAEEPRQQEQERAEDQEPSPSVAVSAHAANGGLFQALLTVVVIFLLDVAVLWALSKIGGPLKAEVRATIKKFGGNIWITAAGLVGCFLAIAVVGLGSVYLLSR